VLKRNQKGLLIISATAMWKVNDETFVFEPTLREVEMLTDIFETITWIGFGYSGSPSANARASKTGKINFIFLPKARGGFRWYQKVRILYFIPGIVFTIVRHIRRHTVIHSRGPSLPAFVAIVFSKFDSTRKFWHKYAGNWRQVNPPFAYGLQRWFLKRNQHFVTVNGRVKSDSEYIHSFENPCFTLHELTDAKRIGKEKEFSGKLSLLFVGRMEEEKGALSLVQAFKKFKEQFTLTMVGDGKDMKMIRQFINDHDLPVTITGFLSRSEINQIYKHAHFFILPSYASEGFPKVISEAAGFGCIPIVTSVSVVGEYFDSGVNGFVLCDSQPESIEEIFCQLPDEIELKKISNNAIAMADLFTYERYNYRINVEFLERA